MSDWKRTQYLDRKAKERKMAKLEAKIEENVRKEQEQKERSRSANPAHR